MVGRRDGRVLEESLEELQSRRLRLILTPSANGSSLEALIRETEARAESPEITEQIRRMASGKRACRQEPAGRGARESDFARIAFAGCARNSPDAGMRRANELGWPNTYTFTKSLAESLIRNFLERKSG